MADCAYAHIFMSCRTAVLSNAYRVAGPLLDLYSERHLSGAAVCRNGAGVDYDTRCRSGFIEARICVISIAQAGTVQLQAARHEDGVRRNLILELHSRRGSRRAVVRDGDRVLDNRERNGLAIGTGKVDRIADHSRRFDDRQACGLNLVLIDAAFGGIVAGIAEYDLYDGRIVGAGRLHCRRGRPVVRGNSRELDVHELSVAGANRDVRQNEHRDRRIGREREDVNRRVACIVSAGASTAAIDEHTQVPGVLVVRRAAAK